MKFALRCLTLGVVVVLFARSLQAGTFKSEFIELRKMVGRAEYDASFDRCKAMIVQHPTEGILYDVLAEIAMYAGRTDDAMSFLWERVEDGTGLSLCYFGLGNLSYRREDDHNAIMFLSKAIELGVEVPECYSYFVYAYERSEGGDPTLKLMTSLCHRHPKNGHFWYGLASAYWSNADFANVLLCTKEAARFAPTEPMFRDVLAAIRLAAGVPEARPEEIMKLADDALAQTDIARHCFLAAQLVQIRFKEADYERADSIANRIVSISAEFGYKRWAGWGYQQLGEAAFLRGDYDRALVHLESAISEARRAGDYKLIEQILSCTFEVHNERGDLQAACLTAQQRLESELRWPRSRNFVRSMNDMASVLHAIGLPDLALEFAVEALSMADQLRLDSRVRCELNTTVGMIHLSLGELRSASRHLVLADELVRDEPYYDKVKSVTTGNLGELELARGKLSEAERYFRLQRASAVRAHFDRQVAGASLNLGVTDQARRRYKTAIAHLHSAYSISSTSDIMPIVSQSIVRMAQLYEELGSRSEALKWYRALDSIALKKRRMGWYWGDWSLDKWMVSGIKEYATLLARDGRTLEAWRAAEIIAQERSWSVIAAILGPFPGSDKSNAVREAKSIIEYGQSLAKHAPNTVTAPTNLQILIARSGVVATELSRRAELAERLGYLRLWGRDLSDNDFLSKVRGILGKEGVLVQYVVSRTHLLIFCASQDSVLAREVRLGEERIRDMMADLSPVFSLSGQASSIWNAAMADFDVAANIALRDSIWNPIRQATQRFPTVYVVPDGPLSSLPLEILIVGRGLVPIRSSFANIDYLVRHHAFSYHSSTTAILASEDASSLVLPDVVFGFGDPDLGLGRIRTDLSLGMPSLPAVQLRLPEAREEVESMHDIYHSVFRRRLDAAATEGSLKDALSKGRIIHVAAHGFFNRNFPFLSWIRLSPDSMANDDGLFHTFEFAAIAPPAPVLVLSGCNTLVVSGVLNNLKDGAEIRTSPARITIGSLWNVDDRTTALLMKKLHEHIATGISVSDALTRAKTDLIEGGIADPFEWGAFVVVGRLPKEIHLMPKANANLAAPTTYLEVALVLLAILALYSTGRLLARANLAKPGATDDTILHDEGRRRE